MNRIVSGTNQRAGLISHWKRISRGTKKMALTKFEYVKSFEGEDKLEPLQWVVVRIKLLDHESLLQSNSVIALSGKRLLDLMLASSLYVVKGISEITLSYGYSNVVNFVLQKETTLYKRRASKLLTFIASLFTSCFVTEWRNFVHDGFLQKVPVFEGSVHLLPQDQCLRDFLTREQKYCHEINLEETVFRNLMDVAQLNYFEALKKARNSTESQKNELLFALCNINYNNEPPENKKGTIFLKRERSTVKQGLDFQSGKSERHKQLVQLHKDFNKDEFWNFDFGLQERTKLNYNFNCLNSFHRKNRILPHTWLVVRVDGKAFHKFSELHNFAKPNENRALKLMSASAENVMAHFPITFMAYGQSDEYSFLIKRYGHREKDGYSLISRIVTVFTATFVQLWRDHFKDQELLSKPSFDARLVLYPTTSSLRDYLSWRQADCHINNMYNTCFWNLVSFKGLSPHEAQERLKGTFSKDKLAILKDECGVEYSEEAALHRKGTTIVSKRDSPLGQLAPLATTYDDLIGNRFWAERPWLLEEVKSKSETTPNSMKNCVIGNP